MPSTWNVTRSSRRTRVHQLLLIVAAVVAETLIPRNPALIPGDHAPILTSLTSWDGWYYLGIVRDGYHADPVADSYRDVAFAPLFPVVVRILSAPWPSFAGLAKAAAKKKKADEPKPEEETPVAADVTEEAAAVEEAPAAEEAPAEAQTDSTEPEPNAESDETKETEGEA